MVSFETQIIRNSGGRITIPKPIREALDLKDGDRVRIVDLERVDKNPKEVS